MDQEIRCTVYWIDIEMMVKIAWNLEPGILNIGIKDLESRVKNEEIFAEFSGSHKQFQKDIEY